ncbi:MAG: TIGR03067 domain-containing protein [Planctomycetes bacterium]|nr:TIGR03067 domain-containing protein [Planctomycetota bacterium]
MIAALVALALAAPAAPEEKEKELSAAAKKELKALEGKWTATKITIDGTDVPAPDNDDKFIEFKGRKFLLGGNEFFDVTGLDPSADPKLIDFKGLRDMGDIQKGTVYEAIYKLEKDTLTLALYFGSGQKRPDKFESGKDSKIALVTLEREKK